jgi:hypothetical protein
VQPGFVYRATRRAAAAKEATARARSRSKKEAIYFISYFFAIMLDVRTSEFEALNSEYVRTVVHFFKVI